MFKYIFYYTFDQNNERLFIIGDAANPAVHWLVKPWQVIKVSSEKEKFNKRYSSARMAIEHDCVLLKSRWRILLKRPDTEFHHLYCYIIACFILYNICINNGDDQFGMTMLILTCLMISILNKII